MDQLQVGAQRSQSIPAEDKEVILVVGADDFNVVLDANVFQAYKLAPSKVAIQKANNLKSEQDMEQQTSPVIAIVGLSDKTEEDVSKIRTVWPTCAVMIFAEISQIDSVYALMARGAVDFIPMGASTSDIQSKLMLRLGVYRMRASDSSRNLGRLTINLMQRTVTNGLETATLTPIEVKIVTTLADSLGGVVQRNVMKQICWGDTAITDNALNRKIYEVRRTLRKLSEEINIRTIYGLGFELSVKGESTLR